MPADVSGLLALAAELDNTDLSSVESVVKDYGDKVAQSARDLAPVRTGKMKGSIKATAQGLRVEVEATEFYAQFVEFGTSKMAPEPFMEPALAANEDGFADDLAKAATKALGG